MKESVRSWIRIEGHEKAVENFKEKVKQNEPGWRWFIEDLIEIFRDTPKPAPFCLACNNPATISFSRSSLKWELDSCPVCREKHRLETIKKNIRPLLIKKGVPQLFLGAEINQFPSKYRSLGGNSLFITGDRGVGKTHLLAAVMREVFLSGLEDLFFIPVTELLLKIRSTFQKDSAEDEEGILKKFGSIEFLFLDDLGVEKTTEWALQTLYVLIDRRYREMKKTFITSNLTLDELSTKLDDRITSRIAGMCEVVVMKGKDRRIKK